MTEKIHAAFGGVRMTWKKVICISLLCGVVTGLLMLPPFLQDTSFQQPGISFEFWILFALFIVLNCEKPLEAGLKTFVAFVISQPVIYLVQVPFSSLGWQLMRYYPRWILPTILTFPGGIVAWRVKRGDLLSVLILSVANLILCVSISYSALTLATHFPHMLVSTLFMLGEVIFFILLLFKDRKMRLIAFILAAAMLVFGGVRSVRSYQASTSSMFLPAEGEAPYELLTENVKFTVSFSEEEVQILYRSADMRQPGTDTIRYRDSSGAEHEIQLSYGSGSCSILTE